MGAPVSVNQLVPSAAHEDRRIHDPVQTETAAPPENGLRREDAKVLFPCMRGNGRVELKSDAPAAAESNDGIGRAAE